MSRDGALIGRGGGFIRRQSVEGWGSNRRVALIERNGSIVKEIRYSQSCYTSVAGLAFALPD